MRSARRELSQVYRDARVNGSMDWSDAARAASILQILAKMIEGSDFEQRLSALEGALAERQGKPTKPNGAGRYVGARP